MNRGYGLRPDSIDSIDYDQFRIDDDGKTLYWTPGDQNISISTTRGGVRFLALSTLASRYGVGGTDAVRRSLGITGYTRKGLSSSNVKVPQQANKTLPSNLDKIELEDLPGIADSARQSAEQVESTLTTIDDQPIDTVWVTQARRELAGLKKAMTGMRDELANNLAKLTNIDDRKSEVERHLQALVRALANLAGKAAAALPGIIGSIVSWLLSTLERLRLGSQKICGPLVIAVGTLLLVAARDSLAR